jgi:hypothetical protein
MVTDFGREFVKGRLYAATDLRDLKRVWETIAVAYQHDEFILALKDQLKTEMEQRK